MNTQANKAIHIQERPRVRAFLALSLDGYIAGENGDLSWLEPYSTDSPESTGFSALMNAVDVLVLGRNSYDAVLAFGSWPYGGKKVIIMTHRTFVPQHGEEAYAGSLEGLLRKLARDVCRYVYLDGGTAVRQGLEMGVVDELTLNWVPVVLGKGIPLFVEGLPEQKWHLQEWRALPSGLLQGKYIHPDNGLHGSASKGLMNLTPT